MQFTYVDAIVAVVTLLSAFLAYQRGLTREVLAIGGWIVAAFAAFYFAPIVAPLIPELPLVGEFLASNYVIMMITAFALVAAAALLILAVFTPIFSAAILESALGPIDRVLGFLFGVARAVVLIAVAYLIYQNVAPDEEVPALQNAASLPIFEQTASFISGLLPDELPGWLQERIDALTEPADPNAGKDKQETPKPAEPAGDGG